MLASAPALSIAGPLPTGGVAEPLSFTLPSAVRGDIDTHLFRRILSQLGDKLLGIQDRDIDAKVTLVGAIWPTHRWISVHPLEIELPWRLYITVTKDRRACAADRLVMYATVESGAFTLTEVHARLQTAGVSIPVQELRASLDRLILAYVLKLQAGRYLYPVPLVRDWLLAQTDGDPGAMLAIEAGDWEEEANG